ncbi:hypothetical protein [Gimesia fumaroli]|uniref:Uncharacterized protein n=1 Tax=Gimesia fumaroli TaxID=2527976 RepID=A0A518IIX1_9PLAN|nr:hypothetical protein [Gimesia fumaroli]QDV53034.1 hypothetical protein Enr17x_51040 [Gimesia fumaroli]
MSVVVTIDMYSGRPNPTWELSKTEAQKLRELLQKDHEPTHLKSPAAAGHLGYRGIQISSVAESTPLSIARVFDGVLETDQTDAQNFVDGNSEIEEFLVGTAGLQLDGEEVTYIQQEIQKNVKGGAANTLRDIELFAVPPYDPGKWNNDPFIRRNNNCYNYSNDKITNTFAQPGRGSGQEGPYPPSCSGTGAASQRDGQRPISNPDITPAQGHIIALVVSTTPGFLDYHWYRRDNNTMWSHKPGGTPATNRDNSGRTISDPRTCDRGPYNIFCGFYHCIPSETRIR